MPSREALEGLPVVEGSLPAGTKPTEVAWIGSNHVNQMAPATQTVTNLLPQANDSLALPSDGVYVGDGLAPVPAKLAARIRRGEYIDMGELLPEFWSNLREEESEARRGRRGRKVTDIFTWLQCFTSYIAVRALASPLLIPELMAYMAMVVRVSQDYPGLAWVRYDAVFRRQAALTGNTRWSVINSSLYTMCFTAITTSTKLV